MNIWNYFIYWFCFNIEITIIFSLSTICGGQLISIIYLIFSFSQWWKLSRIKLITVKRLPVEILFKPNFSFQTTIWNLVFVILQLNRRLQIRDERSIIYTIHVQNTLRGIPLKILKPFVSHNFTYGLLFSTICSVYCSKYFYIMTVIT